MQPWIERVAEMTGVPARKHVAVTLAVVLLTGTLPTLAMAKPPPWAPAHGWRRQHDPHYAGYRGQKWPDDYGVLGGWCDRAKVGAVLGGAVGGAIGSTVGKGDERLIAIVVGTVIGSVVGHELGRAIDRRDLACVGHSLELANTGRTVRWSDPESGYGYALTPTKSFERDGQPCRDFRFVVERGGRARTSSGTACRGADGAWFAN